MTFCFLFWIHLLLTKKSFAQTLIPRYIMTEPKTSTFIFTAIKNLKKNSYFYCYKAWKNKYGGYLSCFNYFSSFGLSVSNTKNQIKAMISFHILLVLFLLKLKNQFLHNFYDVFIQIYSKYKKYLTHRGTPACSKTLHTTIWFWV